MTQTEIQPARPSAPPPSSPASEYRGFTLRRRPAGKSRNGWEVVWFETRFPSTGKKGKSPVFYGRRAKVNAAKFAIREIDAYRAEVRHQDGA